MALKKLLPFMAFLGLGCRSHFQAHDDYELYPESKKEIALYNLQHILEEFCDKKTGRADTEGIHCEQVFCCATTITNNTTQCYKWAYSITHRSWNEINAENVVVKGGNVYVDDYGPQKGIAYNSCDGYTNIILMNVQIFLPIATASSLAKAIQVYLE